MIKRILFQGDSITDSGRGRTEKLPNVALGSGYVSHIASELLRGGPDYEIYNRGVGGNRSGDVYARWHEDALNLDYDLLSILLGINDVGFALRLGRGASTEEFAFIYDHMLRMVKAKKPDVRLVLCQPFVLPVDNDWAPYGNDIYRDYAIWRAAVEEKGKAVERLADTHGALYVRMFDRLDEVMKSCPPSSLSTDGVHPNAVGSAVLADEWLRVVKGAGWL